MSINARLDSANNELRIAGDSLRDSQDLLKIANEDLRRAQYNSRVSQAMIAWEDNHVSRTRRLLDACPKGYRQWEWHYLDSLFQAGVRTFAGDYPRQPELVLTAVNQRILADTPANLFVTVFYGVLDPVTGVLDYCNAGHNPPYFLDVQEETQTQALTRTGLPLGIFEDKVWESASVRLAAGDVLILYTDGVTDAQEPQGDFFGDQRLLACAGSNLGRSAQELRDSMLECIHEFASDAPLGDDLTLVLLVRDSDSGP